VTAPTAPPLLVARVGAERFGFDIGTVREVVAVDGVADVPTRCTAVRGVMRLRERHLSVVSLAALLSGGAPPRETGGAAVVVRLGSAELALEVDEVESVVDAGAEFVAPAAAGAIAGRGVWRCGNRLVTVLDTGLLAERMAALEERGQ
jgi:chemotaxis signal transduction protein